MVRTLFVGLAAALCGCDRAPPPDETIWAPTSSFSRVPVDTYRIGDTTLSSGEAQLFYSYRPATVDDPAAPLFVVTAGGPGASILLLAQQLRELVTLGHTLFIDARNAGFSYVVEPEVRSATTRQARFGAGEYNVFRDAADVAWVLLDFFRQHPEHARRDVYFVAESYGGARTAVLLDLFLSAGDAAASVRPFSSPALRIALEDHLALRFGEPPDARRAAEGFRGQILLQPIIAGRLQDEEAGRLFEEPNSVLDELARAAGLPYRRCAEQPPPCDAFVNAHEFVASIGVSRYDYRAPSSWLDALLEGSRQTARDPVALATTFGVSAPELLSVLNRRSAHSFRYGEPPSPKPAALEDQLPALAPWDSYFVALHPLVPSVFRNEAVRTLDADPDASLLPALFVSNLRYTTTMITRATYDLHVYGPALPAVLSRLPGVAAVESNVERETLTVTLTDGVQRTVDAPVFASSHAVGLDQPVELRRSIGEIINGG